MTIIDISRTLSAEIAVWPGDTPFQMRTTMRQAEGASVNLTTLTLSAHTGSHADAPYHYTDDGTTLEGVALEPFWGAAQVVTVQKEGGPLTPDDFTGYDLSRAPRLLVHSAASELNPTRFPEQYVYPSPELAAFLGERGVILYGTDAPSMDAVDSQRLPGHNALDQQGIAILEGLDLSRAADGVYELVSLPLKIADGDGSPVRAALRSIE
ncbi:MAG: cyclase family protein [Candidatus Promineifilaceae bacterium]|nr:cyclase family protein [Candidatus Promineifilaceae bacterium]